MNYERMPDKDIEWVYFDQCACREAQEDYQKAGVDFMKDLMDYMNHAFVISCPKLFVLARPIDLMGKHGWLIRYARGSLKELRKVLPPLEFIAFCRNNDKTLRMINWNAFQRKAKHV
jgi:hypothetical protein